MSRCTQLGVSLRFPAAYSQSVYLASLEAGDLTSLLAITVLGLAAKAHSDRRCVTVE